MSAGLVLSSLRTRKRTRFDRRTDGAGHLYRLGSPDLRRKSVRRPTGRPPPPPQRPSYFLVPKDKAKPYAGAHRPRLYTIDAGDTVFAPGFKGLADRACEMDRRRDDVADGTLKVYDADLSRRLNRLMGLTPTCATGHQLQAIIKKVLQHLFAFAAKRVLHRHQQRLGATPAPLRRLSQDHQRLSHAMGCPASFTPISDPSSKSHGEDQCEPSTPSTSPSKIVRPLRRSANSNREVSNYDQRWGKIPRVPYLDNSEENEIPR